MKKILVFSLAYFPKTGGAEVAIKEIASRIDDIEFHVVTHGFDISAREETQGRVQVHRVGHGDSYMAKLLFIPRAALAAARLHREHHFDGAWAMMSYMVFPVSLLRIFGVRLPYAVTLQEGDSYDHVFRRLRILPFLPFLRRGIRNAAAISAISNYLADWVNRAGYAGEVRVIPNGVDVSYFSDVPQALIDEAKDALGKRMGDVILITSSRLVHKNAVDDVIEAMTKLPLNVHFVILGSGEEEAKLKRLVAKRDLTARVRFLGHIPHSDLPRYLKAADIFIRPSRTEGMGNSFVEAFAAGIPVIATQEGGLADFIFDEKRNPDVPVTAWAVDKDSPAEIALAVQAIMEKPEKVRAVVATARALVAEKYEWDLIARRMRDEIFAPILEG